MLFVKHVQFQTHSVDTCQIYSIKNEIEKKKDGYPLIFAFFFFFLQHFIYTSNSHKIRGLFINKNYYLEALKKAFFYINLQMAGDLCELLPALACSPGRIPYHFRGLFFL